MSDQTFTQEQLDEAIQNSKKEWMEKELNPIVTERDGLLKFKPKELSDDEKAIQTKQQELFTKEVSLTLKEKGLDQFAEFFTVDSIEQLNKNADKLQSIINELKVNTSYKPDNHKHTDQYSQFEKDKNTTGMIGSKLANLFK